MAQITTTDANEFSSSVEFTPMYGLSNCHPQAILSCLFRRKVKFIPYWQWLKLSDGDLVDLARGEDPAQAQHKPRLVVFHGLEGSLNSPYAHGLAEAAQKCGWLGVVMHFRGCSGEPNRIHRIYHSGKTEDASWFLRWLQRELGHTPMAAIGYSLGGNMLACLLAKESNDLPIDVAVIVSAPFILEARSYRMEKGFSHIYRRYSLNLLKANAARKLTVCSGTLPINSTQLKSVRRIREFDDLITARIHGYADAISYYRQCSATPMPSRIVKSTLIIHAKNDPSTDHQVILKPESFPPQVEYQLTEHGGHVGFTSGTSLHPQM